MRRLGARHQPPLHHRSGRERGADQLDGGGSGHAAAGGVDRAGDRVPGVAAAEHRLRRSGLAGPVPAAALAGLGHRGADHGPGLRLQRLLRRARDLPRLHQRRHQRHRPAGAALRASRGVSRPRDRGSAVRLGPHGPVRREPAVHPRRGRRDRLPRAAARRARAAVPPRDGVRAHHRLARLRRRGRPAGARGRRRDGARARPGRRRDAGLVARELGRGPCGRRRGGTGQLPRPGLGPHRPRRGRRHLGQRRGRRSRAGGRAGQRPLRAADRDPAH